MIVPILLLGLGLAFIVAEVLFPSFGLLSLLATASIIGSVAMAFAADTGTGINFLIAVAVLVPAAIATAVKLFPHSFVGRRMVVPGLSFGSSRATDARDVALVGHEGIVETTLRPSGTARIDGRRVDVVSRGELVEVGVQVRVLAVEGNRVVVVPIAQRDAATSSTGASPSRETGNGTGPIPKSQVPSMEKEA